MQFQIRKLIVWPKSEKHAPRDVEFVLGKVNVITGSSRTGKSAIIPIIDYCLASSDCFIPIDTIRDCASWYGVIIQTESEQLLISRKVPLNSSASNDFYVMRGNSMVVPSVILKPNETLEGVKNILNSLSQVPYFTANGEENSIGYQAHLGFRDLMALVFQNQDIIANQNILFYKTHAHDHRERLRNWFPYILGAENLEILIARQRLLIVEKRLNQLRKELERAKSVSSSWMANMLGHIKVAKEYGIQCADISNASTPDELIFAARQILENIPEYSQTKVADIGVANEEILKLEVEEGRLSSEIGIVKKRLHDIERLKSGFSDYKASIGTRVERLHISQWL